MNKFIIHKPIIDKDIAIFKYSFNEFNFTEEVTFPFSLSLDKSILALCIASSVSYFKLHLAQTVYVDWKLQAGEKEFWQWIFRNGFSELVYKNKLDWSKVDNISFESPDENFIQDEMGKKLEEEAVVGIGGGKDSSVAVRLLQKIALPVLGYSTEVKENSLIKRNANSLNITLLSVKRKIDDQLRSLKEGVYQGHIPVSLIYALTGIVIAKQKNKKYVFVGNEASAEEENIVWLERQVNHQWSKTKEFEIKLQTFVKGYIQNDLVYASLLRPFASLKTVELFTQNCESSLKDFSSCNNNFKLASSMGSSLWCGECAKCLGTYLILADYYGKDRLKEIFGKNLEENIDLENLMRGLLGLVQEKPYDCVATRSEMCVAMNNLNEGVRSGLLFSKLSESDWEFIRKKAQEGDSYKREVHENYLPKEILEKLLKVI